MTKANMLALLAFGTFAVLTQALMVSNAQGAQWYPFYGYNRPSYLSERCVVQTPLPTRQVVTANYPPAEDTATVPTTSPRRTTGAAPRWYPFYGYNRPSYLDQ